VIQKNCEQEGISKSELQSGGQRRRVSRARAKAAYQLSQQYGISFAEIARHSGVCTAAIIKAVQKMEAQNKKL
jgi:transposase-like protein